MPKSGKRGRILDIISSKTNSAVRLLRELLREKKCRDEREMFVAEGDHLCGEIAALGGVELFAYTETAARKYPETVRKMLGSAEKTIVITDALSEYISDTKAPQGMFAAAHKPEKRLPGNARKIVVLDGVQDPGNVGTVIRTAEAFGIDGAVLLSGCADVWSPKTLRAAMGSMFRLPVVGCSAGELSELLYGFSLYGAMLDDTAKRLGEVEFPEKTAIAIGSEGRGISPEVSGICGEKIYIPIKGAESLNAAMAAAVLLWELSK